MDYGLYTQQHVPWFTCTQLTCKHDSKSDPYGHSCTYCPIHTHLPISILLALTCSCHMHTDMQTHTYTHTCMHACTHTHTHTFASRIPVIQAAKSCLVDTQMWMIRFSTLVRGPCGYEGGMVRVRVWMRIWLLQTVTVIYTRVLWGKKVKPTVIGLWRVHLYLVSISKLL